MPNFNLSVLEDTNNDNQLKSMEDNSLQLKVNELTGLTYLMQTKSFFETDESRRTKVKAMVKVKASQIAKIERGREQRELCSDENMKRFLV